MAVSSAGHTAPFSAILGRSRRQIRALCQRTCGRPCRLRAAWGWLCRWVHRLASMLV